MRYIKHIFVLIATISVFVSSKAEILTWAIAPKYQEIKRYHKDIYAYKEKGKWGLIRNDNQVLLPANYDFITTFVNGYALAGVFEGTNCILNYVVSQDGQVTGIREKYYISREYPFFSEGKLPVSNSKGKFGYILPEGTVVIKCQFDNALPFKEGWAPVKKGSYMKYISKDYDRKHSSNTLPVAFHNGELTSAGCFSNGLAPVAYNNDFGLINRNGQKVSSITGAEFNQKYKINCAPPENNTDEFEIVSSYTEFSEKGKYGLKYGDKIIVSPQFDLFGHIHNDGDVITSLNGRYGLLRFKDGEIKLKASIAGNEIDKLEVDKNGNAQPITIECAIPAFLSDYRIMLDDGTGEMTDMTSAFTHSGNSYVISMTPSILDGAEEYNIRIGLESEGVILAEQSKTLSVVYPVNLKTAVYYPREVRADSTEKATAMITAKISNPTDREVTVVVNWSTGKQEQLKISPRSYASSSIRLSETNIQKESVRTFSLKLSTGDEQFGGKIKFKPYF